MKALAYYDFVENLVCCCCALKNAIKGEVPNLWFVTNKPMKVPGNLTCGCGLKMGDKKNERAAMKIIKYMTGEIEFKSCHASSGEGE